MPWRDNTRCVQKCLETSEMKNVEITLWLRETNENIRHIGEVETLRSEPEVEEKNGINTKIISELLVKIPRNKSPVTRSRIERLCK